MKTVVKRLRASLQERNYIYCVCVYIIARAIDRSTNENTQREPGQSTPELPTGGSSRGETAPCGSERMKNLMQL